MSIFQVLRIIWSRQIIIYITVVCSLLGAFAVVMIAQPQYEASARVLTSILKADPVTGENMGGRSIEAYISTQRELIKDYDVTGAVVDRFGWLTDPARIRAYENRPKTDTREFRRWLAQQVGDATDAGLGSGTVLEITYKAPSATQARIGAEALRDAYLQVSLATRRREAAKNAAWYSQQAVAAKRSAEEAETAKANFERSSGIVMGSGDTDLDSQRLAALAGQAAVPTLSAPLVTNSGASMELANIDAQIAQASKNLGPNHPEMVALRARRAAVAQVAEREQSAARAASSGASVAGVISKALQDQKARVIGQRDKVEQLLQLQSEVDLRREQYKKTAARAAELSLEAAVADTGMTPFGVVVAPAKPKFPNKPLMLGGALGLGAGLGLALALLLELLDRRVRGIEDLDRTIGAPCIGVVQVAAAPRRNKLAAFLSGQRDRLQSAPA